MPTTTETLAALPSTPGVAPMDFSDLRIHAFMLANVAKYEAFATAFAKVVSGRRVLDVGTGSGVLAILAARAGARHVTGLDRPHVIELALALKARLGLDYLPVEYVAGDVFTSTLPERFDVIVSETIGYLGFEEDIGPILCTAKHRYGHATTIVLPRSLALGLTPHVGIRRRGPALASFATRRPLMCRRVRDARRVILGTKVSANISFEDGWLVQTACEVTSVAVTFRCDLGNRISISNANSTSWPHAEIPLRRPLTAAPGDSLVFRLSMTRDATLGYGVRLQPILNGTEQSVVEFQAGAIHIPDHLLMSEHSLSNDSTPALLGAMRRLASEFVQGSELRNVV